MIDLPFHVSARGQATLYRRQDGRFQIVEDGRLPNLMTGHRYVLVSTDLLAALREGGADVVATSAILYDPSTKTETKGFCELEIPGEIVPATIAACAGTDAALWRHAERDLFISASLRRHLDGRFDDLVFSEGFSLFAGRR